MDKKVKPREGLRCGWNQGDVNEISRSSLVLDVNTIIDKSIASFTPNTSSCPATLKAKSSPPPGDPSQDRTPVTSSLASTQPSRHEAQPR
ncbi:hypothetical protein SNOG_07091 [Parastagonospora nodorum SN15]|uniref:Uncharacterized protein n=1 Tax=Phaeosphaeria nodorum (strain SN15 / ATCC MYA-4574 / FGSC 10173) TaxID=321614 RepID=Q0UMC3_PHANO|nr:hypothetical protein SNOG_07091 [Parastagonospora nodorum SN15]EAT85742.1 hypothetical protein SNOG_07091 [Parastagonospora nodorum SN15]